MHRPLRLLSLSALTALVVLLAVGTGSAAALGPPSGGIYAHDQLFRTVGTPTDLPPGGKFDTIYALGGDLLNVADAAPGDADFNGGRWEVRPITWVSIAPTQFTNAEQIQAAAAAGQISIGDVVRRFECPLIRAKQ